MLAILERIDPRSGRIDDLVELVACLRPPAASAAKQARTAVGVLCGLLRDNPDLASRLRAYLALLLETRRHTSLYSDIGILSNDGFVTELKRRIAWRILPPAHNDLYLSDALDQVLYCETDYQWIAAVPNAEWLELFDLVAGAAPLEYAEPGRARRVMLMGLLDAIRTLSCRVCALGLEPRLVHSYSEIEDFDSPFLMQNIEVNKYLDDYGRYLDGDPDGAPNGEPAQPEDAKHVLVMLDQCESVVARIRKNALAAGTSVALTYLLVAIAQSTERLRKLLFLVDVSGELPAAPTLDLETVASVATAPSEPAASPRRAAAIALAQELVEAHNTRFQVRGLLRDNVDLLARNVTENASRTGEHYIADSRGELRRMFGAAANAGVIIAFMALFKTLLSYLERAPLVEALLFSANYALGFMLIHVLHWTVATKQPAMTAQRIAADLHPGEGRRGSIDLDRMAVLVNKVFRTQLVAVLGNLVTVTPMAYLVALGYALATGHHLVSPDKARHLIHDSDPIHSLALFHAAIAGVWLFVSGLVSGYYDNKALYTRIGQRVRQLRGLGRLLGQQRLARLAVYIEDNLGGLMGNMYFGILMGVTATVGFLLGLPLDIRHVTFSAANFAIALAGLDNHVGWHTVAVTAAGIGLIGIVNLLVSFGLALWVALRARRIRFRQGFALSRALGRRFVSAPIDFFIGPRAVPAEPVPAPTRETK